MGFKVDPNDLASFSKQLGRAADHVTAAKEYFERECSVGTFGAGPVSAISSICGIFGGGHDGVMENVRSVLGQMHRILDASKNEMSRSADFYEQTDKGEATRLDSQYPESKR
ncbi:WXG100 family type VII secretion target [Streptomyces viridochromogenes]|uniref:WXG100 family type VII secretion target n=1 Tax=Streptomyces viridochromogenes TaxID=1938 RepID=UPI00131D97E7|nr:hypothetical protein [Streptomyces viridochromogenes]